MLVAALASVLLFAQFTAPEGPDGIVYRDGYNNTRFATLRKGRWDAWKFAGYPGNGGQRVTLTPAEAAQVEGYLKKIAALVESTPYAQAQTGWYAIRSIGWVNTRFPTPEFPLERLPIKSHYHLYPFHLTDKRTTVNGVVQWVPDWSHETTSIEYSVNSAVPGPPASSILIESNDDGSTTRFYLEPQPETYFHGFPVYDGTLVIARKGRALFRPVSVERALARFLPLYQKDRQSAEDRLKGLKEKLAETDSPAFAKEALDEFEKEYGHYRTTRPNDYEFRLKVRNEWINRQRAEARAAANPPESGPEGAWYWGPVRALAEIERLRQSGSLQKPACFEGSPDSDALYSAKGLIRVHGSSPTCKAIMEPNPNYFDPALPRTAPQLLQLWQVSRCLDISRNPATLLPQSDDIPHGCKVHWRIWEELDWKALEAILAP